MALIVRCACGKQLRAPDEYAGRRAKCPGCGKPITFPAPDEEEEVEGVEHRQRDADERPRREERLRTRPDERASPRPRPAGRSRDEDEEDRDEDSGRRKRQPRKKGKRKTRSVLPLVLVGLTVLLFLAGGGLGIWWFLTRDAAGDLADWVPDDAEGFVSIRMAEVWGQKTTQDAAAKLKQQNPFGQDHLAKLQAELGMSYAEIDRLTFVLADSKKGRIWMVVSTLKPYDQNALRAKMTGAATATVNGKNYLVGQASDGSRAAVHFASKRVVVFAPEEAMKAALGLRGQKKTGPLDDALKLTGGKDHLVAAYNLPPDRMQPLKQNMEGPLSGFKGLLDAQLGTLTVNLGAKIDINLAVRFAADDQAKRGKSALDGGILMLRGLLSAKEGNDRVKAQLQTALGALKVEQNGPQLLVKAQLDAAVFDGAAPAPPPGAPAPGAPGVPAGPPPTQGKNNLTQIAVAFHNVANSMSGLLPGNILHPQTQRPMLSWRVAILPYIEQDALYRRFKLDEPWNSPNNKALIPLMPKTYALPGDPNPERGLTPYVVFRGAGTLYPNHQSRPTLRSITDGLSNTILVFESSRMVQWTQPADAIVNPQASPKSSFRQNPDGFHVVLADGAVRAVKSSISDETLRRAINPADGLPLGPDW